MPSPKVIFWASVVSQELAAARTYLPWNAGSFIQRYKSLQCFDCEIPWATCLLQPCFLCTGFYFVYSFIHLFSPYLKISNFCNAANSPDVPEVRRALRPRGFDECHKSCAYDPLCLATTRHPHSHEHSSPRIFFILISTLE